MFYFGSSVLMLKLNIQIFELTFITRQVMDYNTLKSVQN